MSGESGFALVVSLHPADATTTLFFGNLLGANRAPIQVAQLGERNCLNLLSKASAVIFVRGLFECASLASYARALGIPTYYFLDDNFMVLREQGGRDAEFVGEYSIDAVRTALAGYDGVLLSSATLVSYFKTHALHSQLMLFPPVAEQPAPAPARGAGMRVAFFGGRHLHETFVEVVLPAVRRLAQRQPLTLIGVGLAARLDPSAGLTIVEEPYHASYREGLTRLARHGVDVLVHPSAAGMANNAYKNPHALISANMLGAVPVVSNVAPYADLCGQQVAICCDDSEESWYSGLATAASDQAGAIRARLHAYCATQFSGGANRDVLNDLVRRHAPPTPAATVVRLAVLQSYPLRRLAERISRRLLPARRAA
jgi:hypothetical protein